MAVGQTVAKQAPGPKWAFLANVDPEAMATTLVAFANGDGGTLVLGMTPEGHVSHVLAPDEAEDALQAALRLCRPPVHTEWQQEQVSGGTVILLRVERSNAVHTLWDGRVLVRRGAEKAGRDPQSVKVWSVLAVACNASEERRLKLITARMATYLQAPAYGELLFAINGWDPQGLADFRNHDAVKAVPGAIDSIATTEQLRAIRKAIRPEWLPAADGTPEQCAKRIVDQFDAGADGVILHASLPDEFAPAVEAYAKIRPAERFAGRTGRPA